MRKMRKPAIGEKLFFVYIGAPGGKNCECIVSRVGSKYFYVRLPGYEMAFHLSDWEEKTDFGDANAIFESEKAWEESEKAIALAKKIGSDLKHTTRPTCRNRFELDKLVAVAKILEIEI